MRCQKRTDTTFASPVLHYRERELVDRLHRDRLREARATVDTRAPAPQPHLQLYGRDYYARKKATVEAAYRDLKLCQKLVEEADRKRPHHERKGPLSLNARTRAKEVERIMKENHKLLDNLDKIQSSMKTRDVLDHDRERQRYVILSSHTKRLAGEYDGDLLDIWEADREAAEARKVDIEARQQRLMSSVNGSILRKRPTTAPSHIQCRPMLCCPRTSLTTAEDVRKHCRPSASMPALEPPSALSSPSLSPLAAGGVPGPDEASQQPAQPQSQPQPQRRLRRPQSAPGLGQRRPKARPSSSVVACEAGKSAAGPTSTQKGPGPTLSLQGPSGHRPNRQEQPERQGQGRQGPGQGGREGRGRGRGGASRGAEAAPAAPQPKALAVVGNCARPAFDAVEAAVEATATLDEEEVVDDDDDEEEDEGGGAEAVVTTGWLL